MSQAVLNKRAWGKPGFSVNKGFWGAGVGGLTQVLGIQKFLIKEIGCLTSSLPLSLTGARSGWIQGDTGRVAVQHSFLEQCHGFRTPGQALSGRGDLLQFFRGLGQDQLPTVPSCKPRDVQSL